MRFALFLALTLALVSTALAQFFCPPNYCSTFKCPELTEASCLARGPAGRFELHPHGGACGCCASCVKILHEGENCVEMMVQDRLPHEICAKDLQCDMANVRCVKKTIASGVYTPNPNLPLFFTIDEAKYRISTAKLTIDIPTRKLVKKFANLEGLELDIGRPEHSQVRKVQLALTGLVPAESKWQRTDISPSSRIQWEKVHGLVQELSETLKQWPGVLIDRFALETIEEFNMTIDHVRSDLEELQQATDELFSNWPNQDFLKQLVEFREQLDPIQSAVKDFHSALIKYMQDVKDLWDTDRIPDLTHQNPVTETMRDVKIRVAYYRIPPSSFFDKVLWFLSLCVLGILLVLVSFGIITCVLKLYQFIKDAKQQGGATRTADTTTEPMNTTPIQWDLV